MSAGRRLAGMCGRAVIFAAACAAAALLIAGGSERMGREEAAVGAGFARQAAEEQLARVYTERILAGDPVSGAAPAPQPAADPSGDSSPWAADPGWFVRDGVMYTPEYAAGHILCVLSVPAAGILRPVFSGTREEIEHDLDIWMVTAARPDYEPGRTHLVIYGHNHTEQDLSFNRLQTSVGPGDRFTVASPAGIVTYEVTRVCGMSREDVAARLVNDMDLPAEMCYLVTCGRGPYRYLDFVVEGTAVK